jgi:hypothetical protein
MNSEIFCLHVVERMGKYQAWLLCIQENESLVFENSNPNRKTLIHYIGTPNSKNFECKLLRAREREREKERKKEREREREREREKEKEKERFQNNRVSNFSDVKMYLKPRITFILMIPNGFHVVSPSSTRSVLINICKSFSEFLISSWMLFFPRRIVSPNIMIS